MRQRRLPCPTISPGFRSRGLHFRPETREPLVHEERLLEEVREIEYVAKSLEAADDSDRMPDDHDGVNAESA
jgi:hypothetical protein